MIAFELVATKKKHQNKTPKLFHLSWEASKSFLSHDFLPIIVSLSNCN